MNEKKRRQMEQETSAPTGLGMAGAPPKREPFKPQILPSQLPVMYSDWFQIQGCQGGLMITLCKNINNMQKENVSVVLPAEIAVDLMMKIGEAYQYTVTKKDKK